MMLQRAMAVDAGMCPPVATVTVSGQQTDRHVLEEMPTRQREQILYH